MMTGWMWVDIYGCGCMWMYMGLDVCGCVWMWMHVDVYGCGGMWMYMDVGGPPKYGLGTPPYGDYVPTSWKNDIISPKGRFFVNFSFRALELLANHEEHLLTFFGFIPPYFEFHAFWRSSSRRTFRDLSIHKKKIISCRLARYSDFR